MKHSEQRWGNCLNLDTQVDQLQMDQESLMVCESREKVVTVKVGNVIEAIESEWKIDPAHHGQLLLRDVRLADSQQNNGLDTDRHRIVVEIEKGVESSTMYPVVLRRLLGYNAD